jgi:DNA-directed RNA polymerase specialized sigma subunit
MARKAPKQDKKRGGRRIARSKRTKRKGYTRPANFDAARMLEKVKSVLNPQQLEIVVWYYFEGLRMKDIGVLLGCGKIAVSQRIDVIDAKLRKAKLPMPRRTEHPYATDNVSHYNLT